MVNIVLATALLVTSALATPLGLQPVPDTTNVTIQARQVVTCPPDKLVAVSFSTYLGSGCTGQNLFKDEELHWCTEYTNQILSYSLSDDISSEDYTLSVYAMANAQGCQDWQYELNKTQLSRGCHTLEMTEGCLLVMPKQTKPR